MKKHWEHRHMEMTLVRPTRGTRTPLIQPNIRYTQETTIDTHIKPKYSPTLHSEPEPRPVQVYSYIYIYLCIYIDLCLYKYQLKGFEELQVHFHEQYLKISGKQKWTLTKTIPFHIQIHQCIFPLHKHFFDTNVEIHKSPKSRDRKRQEPEAFPSLA